MVGRLGVNWPYLLWSLGYEAVWIIIIPIQLTELIFPARRHDSWLGPRSTIACAMACAIASFVAWYTWTQLYVPRFFPEWSYRVPRSAVVLTLLAILALVVLAVGPRPWWLTTRRERPVPARAILAMLSFGAGLLWFAVLFLAYGAPVPRTSNSLVRRRAGCPARARPDHAMVTQWELA